MKFPNPFKQIRSVAAGKLADAAVGFLEEKAKPFIHSDEDQDGIEDFEEVKSAVVWTIANMEPAMKTTDVPKMLGGFSKITAGFNDLRECFDVKKATEIILAGAERWSEVFKLAGLYFKKYAPKKLAADQLANDGALAQAKVNPEQVENA